MLARFRSGNHDAVVGDKKGNMGIDKVSICSLKTYKVLN
jgi:hypothetical protein